MQIHPDSELETLLVQFKADRDALDRAYPLSFSKAGLDRMDRFYAEWKKNLKEVSAGKLGLHGQIDALLFENLLAKSRTQLARRREKLQKIEQYTTALGPVLDLLESRRRLDPVDPQQAGLAIEGVAKALENLVTEEDPEAASALEEMLEELAKATKEWYEFYFGYDPAFSWWVGQPYGAFSIALESYAKKLKERNEGAEALAAELPIGRETLVAQIANEWICYSPEELIEIGEKEYAWCEEQMRRTAQELGFGDDWQAAREHVKDLHEEPGGQGQLVKQLALEAIEYVKSHDLLTVPELAEETWRMAMMPPEKQKVNPFFLGGEQIIVSFPTNEMTHREKLMSMRGNNSHFSRATVQHELIPGHHMQFFMLQRHKSYRSIFGTCFWIEGWALYWELLLWELGFPRGPEDRIGMLFWRMHRCVRIVFSLKYHLGQMSAHECVDMLVERVGHERANAEGEVRRSFKGTYPPLYQAAYMLGALQMWALRGELVDSGKMTNREFHDRILKENQMPIELLRALLKGDAPEAGESTWRFYDVTKS